jgi:hypothetical protein
MLAPIPAGRARDHFTRTNMSLNYSAIVSGIAVGRSAAIAESITSKVNENEKEKSARKFISGRESAGRDR